MGCIMDSTGFDSCPRCGGTLEIGFAHRALGLSFVAPEKLEKFVSIDEDLAHAGFRKFLPSKAEYYRSYLCRSCELYLIDFSQGVKRKEAQEMARVMAGHL